MAAELLAADSGLGQMIEMARQMMRIDIVMVGVVVIGLIGFTWTTASGCWKSACSVGKPVRRSTCTLIHLLRRGRGLLLPVAN